MKKNSSYNFLKNWKQLDVWPVVLPTTLIIC